MRAKRWLLPVLLLLWPAMAAAQLDPHTLLRIDRATFRAKPIAQYPVDNLDGIVLAYGDRYSIARVVRITERGVRTLWRSSTLEGGAIQELLVEDLDGRGGHDLLVRTLDGKVYIFDDTYASRWSSVNEDFRRINAMALANLDADPAYEILFVADNQIYYYDGETLTREQQFNQVYANVIEVLVGNVDSDRELEIILNNGRVLSSLTGDPEWTYQAGFGTNIEIFDIDGDGIDEIIGSGTEIQQQIRIFDVDERQEKPFQ